MQRMHARVAGRVQGVGFRWWAAHRAHTLELTGWVRNLPDGSVETEFQGAEAAVRRFLDDLDRGPASAHVTQVEAGVRETEPHESDFRIR